jgi:hypothetical protein
MDGDVTLRPDQSAELYRVCSTTMPPQPPESERTDPRQLLDLIRDAHLADAKSAPLI